MDVSDSHLQEVRQILRSVVPGVKATIFGSRLKPVHHPYSDLDLALYSGAPIDLLKLSELEEAFSNSDLPYKVDVVDLARVTPEFRRIVEQQEVPI